MYVRTTRLTLKPGALDAFKELFKSIIAPGLQRQTGFCSIDLLLQESANSVLAVTRWATAADLKAIHASTVNTAWLAALRPLVNEAPVQENHSVLMQINAI